MGVEGLRGGREGVRRPYFGSADRSVLWLANDSSLHPRGNL